MKLDELIPRPKVGLGIDIRGGLLCHALLSKAFGRIQLLDWGIEELPAEEKDRPEVLKERLAGLWTRLPRRPTFIRSACRGVSSPCARSVCRPWVKRK